MDIDAAYAEFREDLLLEAEASGDLQHDTFFNLYAAVASDSGETIDLELAADSREGRNGWQIDGLAFDAERGTLYLAVCDFRSGPELQTLNAAQIDALMRRVRTFVERAVDPSFINELEDSSAAFRAAYPIYSQQAGIKRIRVVLFSNGRMSTKRSPQVAEEIIGRPAIYSILDFARYAEIISSRSSPQPIEIDLSEVGDGPIPCLEASSPGGDYRSFLIAMPGELLAEVYGLYGARLLEQNVRTFLQAKTKVNRGIINTLRESPAMFLAFNNGLTATASDVTLTRLPDGQLAISHIRDLQIVNGGQTTASILYAKDQAKADLRPVHVQLKLSVVRPELVAEIVPRISRFANTQNRVSEADFFSSHPFHLAMQQISRRVSAPPRPGALTGSKWFYERARGQYRDASAYMTVAQKRKHELEFPRLQLIDKTDLAKFETTFEPRPDVVSRHAQKCFMHFAEKVAQACKTQQADFNEAWYRNACAKALLFRWTDKMISGADWHAADRGYKSQTVAYTLAWIVERARRSGKAGLNLQLLWNMQEVPEELAAAIETLAPMIAKTIRDAPATMRNVGEYCKQQACWERISKASFGVPELADHLLLDREEAREERRTATAVQRIDLDIGFDELLVGLAGKADLIRATASRRQLLSPKSNQALQKIARHHFSLSPSERKVLQNLFVRLEEAGVSITDL